MKKILLSLLLIAFCSSGYTAEIFMPETSDAIQKQYEYLEPLYEQANKKNDLTLFIKVVEQAYNTKLIGSEEEIKQSKDFLSATAIKFCGDKYEIEQNKKYLKKAFKWSKRAVKDETNQVYSIEADIVLASIFLKPKEMIKAYNLYRTVNLEEANKYYEKYSNGLAQTKQTIKEKNQAKRDAIRQRTALMLLGVSAAGKAYSDAYKNTTPTYINTAPSYNISQPITPSYVPTNQRVDLYLH